MNRKEFLSTILALGGTALASSASISALENKKKVAWLASCNERPVHQVICTF